MVERSKQVRTRADAIRYGVTEASSYILHGLGDVDDTARVEQLRRWWPNLRTPSAHSVLRYLRESEQAAQALNTTGPAIPVGQIPVQERPGSEPRFRYRLRVSYEPPQEAGGIESALSPFEQYLNINSSTLRTALDLQVQLRGQITQMINRFARARGFAYDLPEDISGYTFHVDVIGVTRSR